MDERNGWSAGSAVCVDLGIISWWFRILVGLIEVVLLPLLRVSSVVDESHAILPVVCES